MNGLQTSLYTAAFALCVFTAGILRDERRTSAGRIDYFTLFLAIEAVGFCLELLMAHNQTPLKSLWLGLRLATSLLVAPCLWLAVKETVESARPPLSALGRWPVWLIGLGCVLTLPVLETAHLGVTYQNPARGISALHSRVIHGGMLACIGIFAWQVPHYLWRCRRMLMGQADRLHPAGCETGLQAALAIVFSTWVIGLLRTLHCAVIGYRMDFGPAFALAEVGVTVAAIYAIMRRAAVPARGAGMDDASKARPPAEVKYARSPLTPAIRERIKQKLERTLMAHEVYCDSLLNLRTLSAAMKEKAHYVSQVINQDLGASFYDVVNRRRIERAKQLLIQAPDQTVLEVAMAVGFNSKSTFHTAFREHTGMTPSGFRAREKTRGASQSVRSRAPG
jgi:AraC-like DNA-binding protein